ncbi:hypothetical protein BDW69DRAFT_187069 [Aspergillus filifer]
MGDNADYPNPKYDEKELGKEFNLDALPPLPQDYRPLGYKSLLCYMKLRKPRLADFERWVKFYFWGFDLEIKKPTTHTMAAALHKLLYYTAENHRPKDYIEFDECKRDAGPRLIDWTKIPWDKTGDELRSLGLWYAPVSRFYPNLPARSARPDERFIRPANAPRDWRHTLVEQALFPSGPKIPRAVFICPFLCAAFELSLYTVSIRPLGLSALLVFRFYFLLSGAMTNAE